MTDRRAAGTPALLAVLLTTIPSNLFDRAPAKFGGADLTVVATLIPRCARVQLAWRY